MSGRIRSIKPEWLEDERLVLASPEARVLSIALLLLADDHGNGRMIPQIEASRIFPASPGIFAKALEDLANTHFIELYRLDGQTYFTIRNWKKHQRVDKPGKPRVPGPLDMGVEKIPGTLAKVPGSLATDPDPDPDPDLDHDHDLRPTTPFPKREKKKPKTPSAPPASPDGYAEAVALWFEYYQLKYRDKPSWGPVYGRQMQNLLKRASITELRTLIPAFFAWQRPEVIRGGHSLSTGSACLMLKLDELRADLRDPSRRAFAAQVQARETLGEQIASDDDRINRINALMAREAELEQRDNAGAVLGSANTTPASKALEQDSGAIRRVGHEAQRQDAEILVHGTSEVRNGRDGLSSAGAVLRGGHAPEYREGQDADARPAGTRGVQTTTKADREPV